MKTLKLAIAAVALCAKLGALVAYSQELPQLRVLLQQLESPETTNAAKEELLTLGKENPRAREHLATYLPAAIAKGPDNRLQPWINSVQLAGELRITEAAPNLADWVGQDLISMSLTLGSYVRLETDPAGKALAQIGDPAVPVLAGILQHGVQRARAHGVYALALIRSDSAKAVLRQHLKDEPDPDLRSIIQRTLDKWETAP